MSRRRHHHHHHHHDHHDTEDIIDKLHRHCCHHERDIEDIVDRLYDHCCKCDDKKHCEHFSKEEAKRIAKVLGVNINSPCFDLDQFWMGLNVELEHGLENPGTNITNNDPIMTGKIALVHLYEIPDYYTRLARMKKEAREYWRRVRNSI